VQGFAVIGFRVAILAYLCIGTFGRLAAQRETIRFAHALDFDEQSPLIGPDRHLYFSVAFHPRNTGGSGDPGDTWFATEQAEGFADPQPIADLSTPGFDLLIGFLHSDTLLVYHQNLYNRQVIFQYFRTAAGWKRGEEQLVPGFRSSGKHFSARLSSDGAQMILSMDSFGSYGNEDIYVSFRQGNSWSRPQNLGASINTSRQELSPFLSADGQTLYFSSNAYEGSKSLGVYRTERIGNGWTEWSAPRPLNLPEMEGFDMYYYQDPYRDRYFFTNTRTSDGYGNILWVEYYAPEALPLANERREEGPTVRENPPAPPQVPQPAARPPMDLSEADARLDITSQLEGLQLGESLVLENLLFERSSTAINDAASEDVLEKLAAFLKRNPSRIIAVEGHTDNRGSSRLNERLSLDRARKVRDILVDGGAEFEQIRVNGWGGTKPIATNTTAAGREKNRRVEIILLE
jgi:outer membrane protein OmpA-like peptidoglycan-associated protein